MGKKSKPPAPDYSAVQKQAAEAQRVANEFGQAQLAENKRQYDETIALSKPIIEQQAALLAQAKEQGDQYFKNYQSGQAVTNALRDQVLADTSARDAELRNAVIASINKKASDYGSLAQGQNEFGQKQSDQIIAANNNIANQQTQEVVQAADLIGKAFDQYGKPVQNAIDLYTSGNSAIRDKYGADIEQDVNRSLADARAGQAQATNQNLRQALRYGLSPADIANQNTIAQSQLLAAAANNARNDSTDKYRNIVGASIGERQNLLNSSLSAATSDAGLRAGAAQNAASLRASGESQGLNARQTANSQALGLNVGAADTRATAASVNRDLVRQDDATQFAKKLDVAGLYNGQIGASQGAYNVANQSGNSAVGNQNAVGSQYLTGINQGNNTILNGQQLALNGLQGVLNSQTSVYNTAKQNQGSFLGSVAGLTTAGAKAYTAFGSSRDYKKDIVRIGTHEIGIPLYEFEYLPQYAEKWGNGKHIGVMVDELINVMPEAISIDNDGDTVVDYSKLMVQ